MSCVNTFAYDLSAYLVNILSPLTGNSEFTVTNSAHFVSTISSETILDTEIVVSFDVESLFTNVPIDGAVQAALQKLENDPSLADRTTLKPAQIADLLTFVLRSTYFQYNGSIYEQREGAAMGSPVSAVIANLYMESFEEQAITTSSNKPRIWRRYVTDTFTILDRGSVDSFLQHLNNQQPSIRFTMETENNKLAFLDTAVSGEPESRLTTSVYRKPTYTDQYLAYDSHHPQSVKRGIVKCLYERAKRLVTKRGSCILWRGGGGGARSWYRSIYRSMHRSMYRSLLGRYSTDARTMLDHCSTDARVKCRLSIDRCIDRYSVDSFRLIVDVSRPIMSVIYQWSVGKLSVDYSYRWTMGHCVVSLCWYSNIGNIASGFKMIRKFYLPCLRQPISTYWISRSRFLWGDRNSSHFMSSLFGDVFVLKWIQFFFLFCSSSFIFPCYIRHVRWRSFLSTGILRRLKLGITFW